IASFTALTGRAFTTFLAGFALKTVGSLVNGLIPFRSLVAGFFTTEFRMRNPPPMSWMHLGLSQSSTKGNQRKDPRRPRVGSHLPFCRRTTSSPFNRGPSAWEPLVRRRAPPGGVSWTASRAENVESVALGASHRPANLAFRSSIFFSRPWLVHVFSWHSLLSSAHHKLWQRVGLPFASTPGAPTQSGCLLSNSVAQFCSAGRASLYAASSSCSVGSGFRALMAAYPSPRAAKPRITFVLVPIVSSDS